MTTIPLRICKAISIYKCQGMTIGSSEMFSKIVVIILRKKSRMNRPGNHMVAVSKIKESDDIAFISNDSNPLTYESIKSVGKSKPFNNRKLFKQKTLLPHIRQLKHQQYWMVTTTLFNGTEETVTIKFMRA